MAERRWDSSIPARARDDSTGTSITPAIDRLSPPGAKIALFRSLFRGREDVFPLRFESRRTGRSGYQPACANEWVRHVCDKPRVKCSACPNQAFIAVTDEIVRWHLTGRDRSGRAFVMGTYPMMRDESCHFVAIDFDGCGWQDDAGAVMDSCRRLALPSALERSRSGDGGHVWLFFAEPMTASIARDLASSVLTDAMDRRPEIGMRSYDRLFPNQDTLPRGGFGNLIALPLQYEARSRGHTVFLDDTFQPYSDQWAFLASLQRISKGQAEALVAKARRRGQLIAAPRILDDLEIGQDELPWEAPPSRQRRNPPIAGTLPTALDLVLADQIYIAKKDLPPALRNRISSLAAFQNPEFYRSQAMRLPVYDKPRVIECAEDLADHIALPRGCQDSLEALLREFQIESRIRDERQDGSPIDVQFQGELREDQRRAGEALAAHDQGVLAATTAFGKTVIAAWLIAARGANTLVLVHRRQLLEQWVQRLSQFLQLDPASIGRVGGGLRKLTGRIDIGLIQSLVRKGVVDDVVGTYGHLVVDECHHLSARSFELVARRAKARYVTGLSATITRKDGHHPIIFMQCGPVRHRVDAKLQAAARPFAHHVLVRPTGFRGLLVGEGDARLDYHAIGDALIANCERNDLIAEDVVRTVREGRSPVILTERTAHLQELQSRLTDRVGHLIVLRGGMGSRQWRREMKRMSAVRSNEERVLLATGRFLGEGFDDPRLDTLFLAFPVSWRGTIAQYAGRLHRIHHSKREVRIYDYADLDVPMLSRMFERRCRGYEGVGYSVQMPASAVPGWPVEVPLPFDPEWKRDHAAAVRRLVRDGIDPGLANLFGHAALRAGNESGAQPTGCGRARSATEAFLHRRLETLASTSGRFRLNDVIPIPFDGNGEMEVDLLCRGAKVAVELDGPQHLSDPEAYRRDRRKDALLQENGYFVLRFLTEDVGTRLNEVLDGILRALSRRENGSRRAK